MSYAPVGDSRRTLTDQTSQCNWIRRAEPSRLTGLVGPGGGHGAEPNSGGWFRDSGPTQHLANCPLGLVFSSVSPFIVPTGCRRRTPRPTITPDPPSKPPRFTAGGSGGSAPLVSSSFRRMQEILDAIVSGASGD